MLAFGLALFFHLSGLFLFRVQPFQSETSNYLFKPVAVDVSSDVPTTLTLEKETQKTWLKSRVKPPELSEPLAHTNLPKAEKIRINQVEKTELLSQFKRKDRYPLIPLPNLSPPEPLVEIRLSGSLAHWSHKVSYPVPLPKDLSHPPTELTYSIRVDHESGIIFYASPIQKSEDPKLQEYGKAIIAALRFFPKDGFVSKGILELYIR